MSTTYPNLPNTTFPEEVQSFVTMLNMTASDSVAVAGYQQAMQNGDTVTAQEYYNRILSANQKFVDATKMNTLMDTCVALQKFYVTDIEPYIQSKQTEWDNKIGQFSYVGNYSPSVKYQINNFVLYNVSGVNRLYLCIAVPPTGTAPTVENYWREISIRGEQGESGVGLSFRYAWSASETYYENDIVTYGNAVWVALVQNTASIPTAQSPNWRIIYHPEQAIYPFQVEQPTEYLTEGDLWFQITSTNQSGRMRSR